MEKNYMYMHITKNKNNFNKKYLSHKSQLLYKCTLA